MKPVASFFYRWALPWLGLVLALAVWGLGVTALESRTPIAHLFSPVSAFKALGAMVQSAELWGHVGASVQRVAWGMLIAMVLGIPAGLALGLSPWFRRGASPLVQVLRMISPLSWMPLAVMVLGIGDAPVVFLLVFAAVWPIMLNTAAGVAALDPNWLRLAESLSATRWESLSQVVIPGVVTYVLTGVRLAIGIVWIVLVPAEMLGVSSGLGYFILDTRDRMAYDELMAVIIVIGVLGLMLDAFARALHTLWAGRKSAAGG